MTLHIMRHWQKAILFRKRADTAMDHAQDLTKSAEYRRAWEIVARDWEREAEREEQRADEGKSLEKLLSELT